MILYYSGTGNSWMIANRGEWMGEIPVSMNRRIKDGCTEQVSVNERAFFARFHNTGILQYLDMVRNSGSG